MWSEGSMPMKNSSFWALNVCALNLSNVKGVLERVKARRSRARERSLFIGREPLTHTHPHYTVAFNLKYHNIIIILWGLHFLSWHAPWWIPYPWQTLNHFWHNSWSKSSRQPMHEGRLSMLRSSSSCFVGPKPMSFQAFFGFSSALCLIPFSPWYITLNMITLHFFNLSRARGLVELSNSKFKISTKA